MTGALGVILLAQQARASDEAETPAEPRAALCGTTEPLADGVFQGVLAFGDRHGDIAIVEACPEKVFGLDYGDSGLFEPENAELLAFLRRQAMTDRFAAVLDIRADFEPNTNASPRYPGMLKVRQILAFRPTERRLFDFLETKPESAQARTTPTPSP